jgi:hypothetical protein
VWREHRGIDTARVHLAERVGLGVGGDLTVPGSRGVASVPEVDLGVDDPRLSDALRAAALKHLTPTGD